MGITEEVVLLDNKTFPRVVAPLRTVAPATVWFNGMNVPWDNFGADIGGSSPFPAAWFETFFTMCNANGINVARYWLHANGYATPSYNSSGAVSGLSTTFLSDLKSLCDMSQHHQVALQISLWSFDMCKVISCHLSRSDISHCYAYECNPTA